MSAADQRKAILKERHDRCFDLFNAYCIDEKSQMAVQVANGDYFKWKKGCQEYYKEYHRHLKIVPITEDPIFVEDLQGVNIYFKDNDGRFVTQFKVVRTIPESTLDYTDYYLKVYFL